MSYLGFRHFLVTIFIVGLIYVPLLWLNGISPIAYFTNTKNHTSASEVSAIPDSNKQSGVKKTKTIQSSKMPKQVHQEKQTKSAQKNVFSEFSITGISTKIQLNKVKIMQKQVEDVWQRFSDNDALHESVGWIKGSNAVYAYYHSFNSSFTSAILTVGYESGSTVKGLSPVIVKSGIYKTFAFNSYGISPDEAWEYAYPKATILERYKVDINGKTHYKDVLVIHPQKKK